MDYLLAGMVGGAFGFGLLGLAISGVIKSARKLNRLPRWPVIAFALLGALVTLGRALGPHQISN